jgi:hypothetical protein
MVMVWFKKKKKKKEDEEAKRRRRKRTLRNVKQVKYGDTSMKRDMMDEITDTDQYMRRKR